MNFKDACHIYVSSKKRRVNQAQKIMRWNPDLTVDENAKMLRITYEYAYQMIRKYSLSSISIRKNKNELTGKKLTTLLKVGFTYDEIGRIFGITRQAICERVKNAKTKN